jgi:hypothetical protein
MFFFFFFFSSTSYFHRDILNDKIIPARGKGEKKERRNTVKQKSNSSTGTGSDNTHKIGHPAKSSSS